MLTRKKPPSLCIGFIQFCLKFNIWMITNNKLLPRWSLTLHIKHGLKKKNKLKVFTSICFPVFTLIYIYKNVYVWSSIFCTWFVEMEWMWKMFIFVNERSHLCIYIISVQTSGIDKCYIMCCWILNVFSMIFYCHEWNVRLQYWCTALISEVGNSLIVKFHS